MTSIPQTEIQIAQKKLDGPKPTKKTTTLKSIDIILQMQCKYVVDLH